MTLLITLFIIVIILGALLGGKSFGGTIRTGCGVFSLLLMILIGAIYYAASASQQERRDTETVSSGTSVFRVKEDCETYTKPTIDSDIAGYLVKGDEVFIENPDQFNYFYALVKNGQTVYIRKACLTKP